jgi:hypothetical protein
VVLHPKILWMILVTNEAKLLHWWQIKETPMFGLLASSIKTINVESFQISKYTTSAVKAFNTYQKSKSRCDWRPVSQ